MRRLVRLINVGWCRGGRGTHAQSNTHVANFLYCWPVEPQLTKGTHHSLYLVLVCMPMVCRIVDDFAEYAACEVVLHLCFFHNTAFLISLLLVLVMYVSFTVLHFEPHFF